MSLEEPTALERLIEAAKGFGHWRYVLFAVAGIALLGLVLFTFDKCGDWRFNSKNDKLKANVNAAIAEADALEKQIANLKERQAAQTENVNRAAQDYLNAQNYTDETRREVNAALGNMANAAKSNGNITVNELKEKMKGL